MKLNKLTLTLLTTFLIGDVQATLHAAEVKSDMKTPGVAFVLTSRDARMPKTFPEEYVLKGYGCAGGNQSPPLSWRGAPHGTRSFVLTLFDKDERSTPSGWWHWVVYNLPADANELPTGAGALLSTKLPNHALQGRTDLGSDAYHGPCPAKGDPPHRYVFTLYALDVDRLDVPAESSGAMVVSTLQDHMLGHTELTVLHAQ